MQEVFQERCAGNGRCVGYTTTFKIFLREEGDFASVDDGLLIGKISHSDEYCPHCDNHFVLEAKMPQARLQVESEDVRMDARMLKDERLRAESLRTIFDVKEAPDKLG